MLKKLELIIFIAIFSRQELAEGLRLINVRVEEHTVRGNGTTLECRYDLQGETLYSVKWYKDGHEFYRFVPRDVPPAQIFPLPGVHVDLKSSDDAKVNLRRLDLSSSGKYRCEVSAEAPSFQTVSGHGDMLTVALPDEGPRISGGKPRYQVGDTVSVKCTSGLSKPAAQLMWYINGEPANVTFIRGPNVSYIGREGLEETTLGLEFKVKRSHFIDNDLKLKCLASIATVYWKSNEESVVGERVPKPHTAMGVKYIVGDSKHSSSSRADKVLANMSASSVWHACPTPTFTLILLGSLQYLR